MVINCKAHISLNSAIWIEYYPCSAGVSSLTVQPMVTASQTGTQGAPARSLPFPPAGMNVSQLPQFIPHSPPHQNIVSSHVPQLHCQIQTLRLIILAPNINQQIVVSSLHIIRPLFHMLNQGQDLSGILSMPHLSRYTVRRG